MTTNEPIQATLERITTDRINVFVVDGTHYFRHYFDGDAAFRTLEPYYDNYQYRFAVPDEEYATVERRLARYGYQLVEVDRPAQYAVLVEKYTDHPDDVFKHSVLQLRAPDHNCFLLGNQSAVASAVDQGATRLVDTDYRLDLDGG